MYHQCLDNHITVLRIEELKFENYTILTRVYNISKNQSNRRWSTVDLRLNFSEIGS